MAQHASEDDVDTLGAPLDDAPVFTSRSSSPDSIRSTSSSRLSIVSWTPSELHKSWPVVSRERQRVSRPSGFAGSGAPAAERDPADCSLVELCQRVIEDNITMVCGATAKAPP